jgi:hypothetical protein
MRFGKFSYVARKVTAGRNTYKLKTNTWHAIVAKGTKTKTKHKR